MEPQPDFERRLKSIEELLGKIEGAADPALLATVQELLRLVMDLHGAGLERMLEVIRRPGEAGDGLVENLGRDELVASLLVLHALHPLGLEDRVAEALDRAAVRLRAHEGEVELLTMQDGVVRLRLQANGRGCGSTAAALKEMIENEIYRAAPDVTALVIEGGDEKPGFVPLEMLRATVPSPNPLSDLTLAARQAGDL